MNHFEFRLKSLQALRERERDAAADAYGQARRAIEKLETQTELLMQEHASHVPARLLAAQQAVNSQQLLEVERYQMHLMQQVHQLRSQIQMIEAEAEKRRLVLVQREQAVEALDKLKQRRQAEWDKADQHRAQIALDEWAGFRYWSDNRLPHQ